MTALHRAHTALAEVGAHLLEPAEVFAALRVDDQSWPRFAAHWDALRPDPYAAQLGTTRLRRYGHFTLDRDGTLAAAPVQGFIQPEDSNHLYIGRSRHFAPLTQAFTYEPVLGRLVRMLGCLATALERPQRWSVKVHPFRVIASGADGSPTPEGMHRDGVTMVSSLLIRRRNAVGGQSAVIEADGRPVLSTTLAQPGTLLVGDDRRTRHGVTPIRPAVLDGPAVRDVLVITLTTLSA